MRVWLASGSPRRRQLLEWAGCTVVGHPMPVDEAWIDGESPADAAERLAIAKNVGPAEETVVSSDTVVHLDDRPFGKPTDADDARRMLALLSGRWHQVTTGVCITSPAGRRSFRVTTQVRFRELSAAEIDRYVATGEPMDKAGSYGIQGLGGALVAEVRGSWTNVMGLPLEATLSALEGR